MHDDQLDRLLRPREGHAAADPAFAESLFEQLRLEVGRGTIHRGVRRGWLANVAAAAVVVGVVVLGAAAGAGIVDLPWVAADPSPDDAPPPSSEASPQLTPAASASPPASEAPAPTAEPSDAEPSDDPSLAGEPITIVRTTVDALVVREAPGLDGDRVGSLAEGAVAVVVSAGPRIDGYDWMLLSGVGLPPATGCGPGGEGTEPLQCPTWVGWVASAGPDGDPWLVDTSVDCAEAPPGELQELTLGRPALELLSCYGDRELTFRAWWPEQDTAPGWNCDQSAAIAWLGCPRVVLGWDPGYWEAITVAVDPDAPVDFPERGQWIRVTAHMDDPAAAGCGDGSAEPEAMRSVLRCRAQLVVTAVEPAPAP